MIECDPAVLLNHVITGFEVLGDELIEVYTEDGNPDEPRYVIRPVEGVIDSIEGDLADLCEASPILVESFSSGADGLPMLRVASFYGEVDIIFAAMGFEVVQC